MYPPDICICAAELIGKPIGVKIFIGILEPDVRLFVFIIFTMNLNGKADR